MVIENQISRRTAVKAGLVALGGMALSGVSAACAQAGKGASQASNPAKVYFTSKIDSASLQKIYKALGRSLKGQVAVKISTGEPGGHNFLDPQLIAPLVRDLKGTLVECCTAYAGRRMTPKEHWPVFAEHGFKAIAPCDLLDDGGELTLPVRQGFHLRENLVGHKLAQYDSVLMLSHFKGHAMGGFGGALKNMSIGLASSRGKANIHTAAATCEVSKLWGMLPSQDAFLESMADACKSVLDYKGRENILYINVANKLSVDCDCDSSPEAPQMGDLGIFASCDPVALDQACYDAVLKAKDPGKAALVERMQSRHAIRTVEVAAQHGVGVRDYQLITLA